MWETLRLSLRERLGLDGIEGPLALTVASRELLLRSVLGTEVFDPASTRLAEGPEWSHSIEGGGRR